MQEHAYMNKIPLAYRAGNATAWVFLKDIIFPILQIWVKISQNRNISLTSYPVYAPGIKYPQDLRLRDLSIKMA